MVSKTPAIPTVPSSAPPDLAVFLNAVKSALDVADGGTTASFVTQEQLDRALSLLQLTGGGEAPTLITVPGTPGETDPPDTTPPPAPTGLTATGGFSTVILEWDALPSSPPIAFVTVYRAAVDDFSQAAAVGTSRVLLYADYVPDSQAYYYWIRFTSEAGVEGPINSATGTTGSASLDPSYTKEVLANAITDLEIADKALTDGSIADAAVIRDLIANLAVDGAKLDDLAVDTAKIADGAILSAKIADLAVGTAKIADAAILSAKIADAAIIEAKIGTAAIVTAHIQDAAIIDAKIASLGADKIVAATLAAVTANLGSVTAGEMRSPDNTFLVDLSNKEIIITGPAGQAADDYTVFREGSIEAYEWTGAGHSLAKALRGVQTGIATNGATVTIPGYFRNQPRIIVSPASIPSYLQANQAQDQTLQCIAQNVTEAPPGSGSWQFDAIAQLVIAGGLEGQSPGLSYADSPLNDIYLSSATTTSANVTQLAVLTKVRTYQSNGTGGVYYNRQVTVYLEYREAGTADPWLVGDTNVTQINQESSYVDINLATGTLTTLQYEVRLRYVYANTGGTYTGSGGGTVPQPDVERFGGPIDETRQILNQAGVQFPSGTVPLAAWTPPAGATAISVEYEYDYTATATANHRYTFGDTVAQVFGTGGVDTMLAQAVATPGNPTANQSLSGKYTASGSGSYDPNKLGWRMYLDSSQSSDAIGRIEIGANGAKATISYSLPVTTDTDNHNFATWDTLTATLSGSTVLSSGTVNWQAIGES